MEEAFEQDAWKMKRFSPEEILHICRDENLRWQYDSRAIRIAKKLLRHPDNVNKLQKFNKVYSRKIKQALNANNPFYGNYPPKDYLLPLKNGRIPLGFLPTREWLSIEAEALRRNMIVCGPAGGGKTNFLKGTIRAILNAGGTVIAFDRKGKCEIGDCAMLIGRDSNVHVWHWEELRLSPLKPVEGISLSYWTNLIVSLLSSQWSLIASTTLLMEIVHSLYKDGNATWDKLIGMAAAFKGESYRSEAYRDVIVRNLKSTYFAFGEVINAAESNVIDILTREKGCHIILTDGLLPEHASLLTAFFLIRDYEYRRVHADAQKQLTCYVLDDSMALVKSSAHFETEGITINPLNTIAFMGRSLGMSLIISAQNFNQISSYFTNNCDSIVVCGSYGEDAYALARYMNLNEEQAAYLSTMQPGEVVALARSAWGKAVLGKYPLFE